MSSDNLPWSGPRITLRRFQADDLAAFQAYRTDPTLATYQGWEVVDDVAAAEFIALQASLPMFTIERWNQLAIVSEHNQLIGDIGICTHHTWAELGYTLNRQFHQQGYATEAGLVAIKNIFALTHVWSVQGITDQRNLASIAVLERLGMTFKETFTSPEQTELVYQITRDRIG